MGNSIWTFNRFMLMYTFQTLLFLRIASLELFLQRYMYPSVTDAVVSQEAVKLYR